MLALFKGELSYEDITRKLTYKEMLALKDVRVEKLKAEVEEQKKMEEKRDREMARRQIMAP